MGSFISSKSTLLPEICSWLQWADIHILEPTTTEQTNAVQETSRSPPNLVTIPTELLLQIFKFLDAVPSGCLGLTCKRLYFLHKQIYRKVSLDSYSMHYPWWTLGELLRQWAGPDLVYSSINDSKFRKRVTKEVILPDGVANKRYTREETSYS